MSSTASSGATVVSPAERVEVLFDELAELAGQRNGIDGRIVEIVAELDRDELWGATGARSIAALVAWKIGSSPTNANTIATVAHRLRSSPAAPKACARADCRWIRSASSPTAPPTDPMPTMPSWPRSPPSASCAPRSSWNRDPNPNPTRRARAAALDHQNRRRAVQLLPDQTCHTRRGEVRRGTAVAS